MTKERTIKLLMFSAQSEAYLDVLLALRDRAAWFFDEESKSLIVPFVITCAAALECILNDCLIRTFREVEELATQLDGYLSMTLKGKLINVVPLVTAQRFALNQRHKTYHHLAELIRVRNQLVHNRSSVFEERSAVITTAEDGKPFILTLTPADT